MRIPFFLLFLLPLLLFAQTDYPNRDSLLSQARQNLDSLTSERFYGRGYQREGHSIAANFIEEKFSSLGLKPLNGQYQQPFTFKLNLVEDASLSLNGQSFSPGKDFIVNAQSGAGRIELKVVDIGYGLKMKEKIRNKIVVFREGLPESIQNDPRKREIYAEKGRDDYKLSAVSRYSPAAVVILRKKLTASLRPESLPFPILELEKDDYPSKKVKRGLVEVNTDVKDIETQNVLGYLEGTGNTDSVIVLTAHYDHLGGYSDAIFTGANDNASGTSMLLSMADHFVKNPPKYDMLFIAFGAEEAGLQGSAHYVFNDPIIPLDKMKFILNLDLMGNGVDGIMAVGGKDYPDQFDKLLTLNINMEAVPRVRARQNAPNSDHYFFLKNGVPGFFIYTMGGPPHYHDVRDTGENLLFSKYVEVRALLIRFLEVL